MCFFCGKGSLWCLTCSFFVDGCFFRCLVLLKVISFFPFLGLLGFMFVLGLLSQDLKIYIISFPFCLFVWCACLGFLLKGRSKNKKRAER